MIDSISTVNYKSGGGRIFVCWHVKYLPWLALCSVCSVCVRACVFLRAVVVGGVFFFHIRFHQNYSSSFIVVEGCGRTDGQTDMAILDICVLFVRVLQRTHIKKVKLFL